MSGSKRETIQISADEYERLRNAERNLRAQVEPGRHFRNEIHAQVRDGIQSNLLEMTERQRQLAGWMQGLSGAIEQVEKRASQNLMAQQSRLAAQLEQNRNADWQNLSDYFTQTMQQVHHELVADHHLSSQRIAQLEAQSASAANSAEAKQERAGQWVVAAESLFAFLTQNYIHEFFLPGEVQQLQPVMLQARENLEMGMPEAALVSGQQSYFALSQIRLELEQRLNEWQMLSLTVWEKASQLHQQIMENQIISAVDLDGNLLKDTQPIDVDAWTQGHWSALGADVRRLLTRLEDASQPFDIRTLRRFLRTTLPRFAGELDSLVVDARVSVLNSQMRINVADLVIQALETQGFTLEAASFEQTDMRNGYTAQLVNLEGGEVRVKVVPSGSAVGENELFLDSFDKAARTKHELHQRWDEINQSLALRGLVISNQQADVAGVREARHPYRSRSAHSLPVKRTPIRE